MGSNHFCVASLGFFTYNIMSSANSGSFTSFPIWIPLFLFSSLITMARTSNPMLNKSVKNEHPHPVSDLRGNAFSFSLKKTLAIGLSCMVFIMLRNVASISTLLRIVCCFIINGC